MARELPGYIYDPETKRYYKDEPGAPKRSSKKKTHVQMMESAEITWEWSAEPGIAPKFKNISYPERSHTHNSIFDAILLEHPPRLPIKPEWNPLLCAYPVLWDNENSRVGVLFCQRRILQRIDANDSSIIRPIFTGNQVFQQSNFILRTACFKHGLILCSFDDCIEDLWDAVFMRVERFGDPWAFFSVEGRFNREDLGGAFQAADINPVLGPHREVQFLLAVDNKLVLGRWSFQGPEFIKTHGLHESLRIMAIKYSPDGNHALVSCTGGTVLLVSLPELSILKKVNLEGSAIKSIVSVDENLRCILHTFHERIVEVDFSRKKPFLLPAFIELSPFKNPDFEDFKVVKLTSGSLMVAQIGSDQLSCWSWDHPMRPDNACRFVGKKIVDISLDNGKPMVLYSVQ